MKVAHLMPDSDRSTYLCGAEKVLPLPHNSEDWRLCRECQKVQDDNLAANPDEKFGLGVSFAKR